MPLIIPKKQQIDFFLRTTKPFHHKKAAEDFFRVILSYGPDYRPAKYGRSEPVKEIFDERHCDTIAVQLTETVFEDISEELREQVVEYFEGSVEPDIRTGLGKGFLFRPYQAAEKYDKKKKLVPEFPIRELFGKNLAEGFEHGL